MVKGLLSKRELHLDDFICNIKYTNVKKYLSAISQIITRINILYSNEINN